MAAGTRDEPRDEATAERAWSPVPPLLSIPQLPNDRLGFAGSGLFGLGALLVSAPPKPESAELPAPAEVPDAAQQSAATDGSAYTPDQAMLAQTPAEAPTDAEFSPMPDPTASAGASFAGTGQAGDAPEMVTDAGSAEEKILPLSPDRPDPMPGLIADLNRRMHGIEQRLDITLLEIEQATRELRDAAKDQREASEMLRAMHMHQRAAPREERPASGGIRPASLAASDLVPPAAVPKLGVADAVVTAAVPIQMAPDPAADEADPAQVAASGPPDAKAVDAASVHATADKDAPSTDEAGMQALQEQPTSEQAAPEIPKAVEAAVAAEDPTDSEASSREAVAAIAQAQSVPAPSPEPVEAGANPARGLLWLVLALVLIAFVVWLLGPGRGYLSQAFDPRAWSATFGWAADGIDHAHVTLVEWSDAFRRMIRG